MPGLLAFPLDGNGSVTVEIAEDAPGFQRASPGDGIARAKQSFRAAFDSVRDAAQEALDQFTTMVNTPDKVELQFGVRLSAEAGAIIAKTAMESHFHITLTWSKPGTSEPDSAA